MKKEGEAVLWSLAGWWYLGPWLLCEWLGGWCGVVYV